MGASLVSDAAKVAFITMFVSAFGCVVAGGFALPMTMSMNQSAVSAFRLAKLMALLGGVSALVFGSTATLYFWLTGQASEKALVLIEMALLGAAVVFAIAVAIILGLRRSKTR